jgi:glutamine cyclotransferase
MIVVSLLASCSPGQATSQVQQSGETQPPGQMTAPARVPTYTYEIINTYPHDPDAFTQGLVFHQGSLYESTGLNGQSSIRKVDLLSGQVLKKVDVSAQYFGEGVALFNGRAYQLTWQSQRGFIYDLDSFQLLNTFSYTGEGWGLTHDDRSLILSDGSNQIRFLEPNNFEVQRTLSVYDGSRPINYLNELEYIKGEIYANIWQTDRIARIDPQSGRVIAWIDLSALLPAEDRARGVDVLNGIAYDESGDRLFVTGKLWPKLFEIKLKQRRLEIKR